MQYNGEFPLRALKGKNVAQCVERSCLAQNILKMCGYESSINFGDAESHGNVECHAWNIIRYNNGYLLIDFSNTAHEIENGSVVGRRSFSFNISLQDFEEYKSGKKDLITRDFHYEKGKKYGNQETEFMLLVEILIKLFWLMNLKRQQKT